MECCYKPKQEKQLHVCVGQNTDDPLKDVRRTAGSSELTHSAGACRSRSGAGPQTRQNQKVVLLFLCVALCNRRPELTLLLLVSVIYFNPHLRHKFEYYFGQSTIIISQLKMPTVGIPACSLTTQAVGAALLHQFARDRFIEAGVEDRFLRDAELNLENLTTDLILLHNENGSPDQSILEESYDNSCSSDRMSDQSTLVHETSTCGSLTSNLSTATVVSPTINQNGTNTNDDQFHSMAETTTNSNGHPGDGTMYHSMRSGLSQPTNSLDQLSSTSLMSVYGRELRLIAEEFARSRQRQVVKDQASKVRKWVSLLIEANFRLSIDI